jgi:hypothetical protein
MSLRSHDRLNVIADNSRRACFFASHDGLCLSVEAGGFLEPGLGKHSWFNASGGEIRGGTVSLRGAVIIAHWATFPQMQSTNWTLPVRSFGLKLSLWLKEMSTCESLGRQCPAEAFRIGLLRTSCGTGLAGLA